MRRAPLGVMWTKPNRSVTFAAALGVLATSWGCFTPASDDGVADQWGKDDRKERYQVADLADQAAASVNIIEKNGLQQDGATYTLGARAYGPMNDLCEGAAFFDQPTGGHCSGTLITEDLVMTAGHCVYESDCANTSFLFDFAYGTRPSDLFAITRGIPANNVYNCRNVEFRIDDPDSGDVALIRLDRPVVGRSPVAVEWELSMPAVKDTLTAIGHPARLPQKLSAGKVVKGREQDGDRFVSFRADLMGGNSGSGVFDSEGTLVGVAVSASGESDFVPTETGCMAPKQCTAETCDQEPRAFLLPAIAAVLPKTLATELGIKQ